MKAYFILFLEILRKYLYDSGPINWNLLIIFIKSMFAYYLFSPHLQTIHKIVRNKKKCCFKPLNFVMTHYTAKLMHMESAKKNYLGINAIICIFF